MRGLAVWVAVLSGCGRIGYDARLDAQLADSGSRDARPDGAVIDAPRDGSVAPIAFIQATGSSATNVTKVSAKFDDPVHVGDLVVVAIDYFAAGASITGITDSLGSTYAIAVPASPASAPTEEVIAYTIVTAAGPPDDITVAFNITNQIELRIHEFAGISTTAPLDPGLGATGFAMGTGSPPDLITGPTITTRSSNELVFGFELSGIATVGPGYTLALNFDNDITEYKIAATAGSYTPTAEQSNGPDWWIAAAAFQGQ